MMTLSPEILEDLEALKRAEPLPYSWHLEKIKRELEEIHATYIIISAQFVDLGPRGGYVLAGVASGDAFKVSW